MDPACTDDATFENAIQESVSATSRGNTEEDAMIERAIRASVAELRRASKEGDEKDAVQRAIQASIVESNRSRVEQGLDGTQDLNEHDRHLEEVLRLSVQEHGGSDEQFHAEHDWDDSGIDTDDDENIKLALENSRRATHPPADNNNDLEKAIQESKEHHQRQESDATRARTEEEIVLEYVKKQSLAEEEHRRNLAAKGKAVDRD